MVDLEIDDGLAVITIDRPHARNAISLETMDQLEKALDGADGAAALVITGAGEKAFVSGGDLKELSALRTEAEASAMAFRMRTICDRIAGFPGPTIAALNGHALVKTMEDLLLHGLQDIYYAEQQIIKSLPKMIEKATNRDLVAGLKGHLEETNKQVERLQKAFEKLGKEPSGTKCPAIDGMIKEADETAGEIEDKAVLDAAIVANAQAVEHYEICRYGTLIAWAEELGHDEIVRFLTTNLNEEKAANTKLNTVALRKGVNSKASTAA